MFINGNLMSKAEKITVFACVLGLSIMWCEKQYGGDYWVSMLAIPILLMLYAKRINKI